MNGFDPSVFGVAVGTIVILLVAIQRLWADNQKLRAEARADQQAVLPALTEATAALAAATAAIDHATRLYDRDLPPRRRGD